MFLYCSMYPISVRGVGKIKVTGFSIKGRGILISAVKMWPKISLPMWCLRWRMIFRVLIRLLKIIRQYASRCGFKSIVIWGFVSRSTFTLFKAVFLYEGMNFLSTLSTFQGDNRANSFRGLTKCFSSLILLKKTIPYKNFKKTAKVCNFGVFGLAAIWNTDNYKLQLKYVKFVILLYVFDFQQLQNCVIGFNFCNFCNLSLPEVLQKIEKLQNYKLKKYL